MRPMNESSHDEPHCRDEAASSGVDLVLEGRASRVGTLPVARLLPSVRRRTVGPFVFLDHMGPVTVAPGEGFDVMPHPHIGLSTVTYLFAGENTHRDSLGSVQVNRPEDLNLMTAGRGVVHSERADPAWRAVGGTLHGLQLWLGLPVAREEDAPRFENYPAPTLPEIRPSSGVRGRVALGAAYGAASPVRHPSAPLLVDLVLDAGSCVTLEASADERAVFVVEGSIGLGGHELSANHLAVLQPGATVVAEARGASRLMLLGGPPLDGPRYLDWNFVSSSTERLAQAVRDWKERRFAAIPDDDVEFVPYPDLPGRASPRS